MIFGAAAFLLATLAGIIPVILHMINRQKAKELPFPTLRFLKISVQKTRRRRQIHDVLLMLLRMAVLILIAIGLAKPTVTKLRSLLGGTNTAVAIIVDNSASMAWEDQGGVRFELAVSAAEQILDELADGDQVALWLTSGVRYPEMGKFYRSQDKVRQILAQALQAGVTYEGGDVGALLEEARRQLVETDAVNKQVFVITDNQAVAWETLKEGENRTQNEDDEAADPEERKRAAEAAEIPVIVVDCNRAPKPNVALADVEIKTTIPVAGVPMKAVVQLRNASGVEQTRVVELYLNGEKIAADVEVKVPPSESAVAEIVFAPSRGGLQEGEVRLAGKDGCPADDRLFFTVEVDPAVPVGIVVTERHEIPYLDDSFYLERALKPINKPNWAIRTTVLTVDELATEPLVNYKVLYLVNVPALSPETAARVASFVEQGGAVFWIMGDEVDPDAYNDMNEQAGRRLLPAELKPVRMPELGGERDSWSVAWLNQEHPALGYLIDPPSLYQSVLVYKYVPCDTEEYADTMILARLDGDGDPVLLQRRVARGNVTLLATSAHVGWTNLPLRPIFVPLTARLTFDLAGVAPAQHQSIAGTPLVVQLEGAMSAGGIEVLPPSGAVIRPELGTEDGLPREFRFEDTHDVGIYRFRFVGAGQGTQVAYAVNADPDESDPAKLPREELEKRLGKTPVVFAENPENMAATFEMLRKGRSLAELFLAAVLIGLVFETFVSNWFSPKEKDEQARYIPGRPRAHPSPSTAG